MRNKTVDQDGVHDVARIHFLLNYTDTVNENVRFRMVDGIFYCLPISHIDLVDPICLFEYAGKRGFAVISA